MALAVDLADLVRVRADKVVWVVDRDSQGNRDSQGHKDSQESDDQEVNRDSQVSQVRVDSQDSDDQDNLGKVANLDLDDLKVLVIRDPVNDLGNLKAIAHNKVAPVLSSSSHASCNVTQTMMAN